MLGVTDFWTYVLGTFLIVLLPGPNSLYVLTTAARHGVKAGYRAACGVFAGDTVLMVLSAAGVASLLRAVPAAFMVIKYAGAGYLAYIGLRMLWGAIKSWRTPAAESEAAEPELESPRPFRKALTISLLNPKAILFFVSFFIQFVDPGYAHPALSFLVLGAVVQLFSFAYLSTLIFSGTLLATHFRRRRKLAAGLTSGAGALFVGFSAKLATASLN
ncbi:leucine efflux protein LeuE [Longispora albida]|uniref:leucine efflux protein LeuE n=1 Tax=Longispora albida TaxID=203523 RepID=UPI0012F8BAED|nr:leucine efflux protein LeuE [Longispora albida]